MASGRRALLALLLLLLLTAIGTGVPAAGSALAPARPHQVSASASASVDDDDLGWGESTTVRGAGFKPGARVRAILYGGGSVLFEGRAGQDGSFTGSITIPSGLGSSTQYRLTVQGNAADGLFGYVEVPLTIRGPTPVVSITDRELGWRDTTTVIGDRYNPGAVVTVSLFPNNTLLGQATVGGDGRFELEVQVPDRIVSATTYQVAVTGQGIDLIFHFDTVEVTIIGDRPTVALSSEAASRGGTLRVTGDLFLPTTVATLTLLPGHEELGEVPIGADGTFSTDVRIPVDAGAKDPHLIVVTGTGADGLFAYIPTLVRIDGGRDPSTGSTVSTLPAVGLRPEVDRYMRDLFRGDAAPRRKGSSPPYWILLLILAVIGLLLFLSRKDVRRRLRGRRPSP